MYKAGGPAQNMNRFCTRNSARVGLGRGPEERAGQSHGYLCKGQEIEAMSQHKEYRSCRTKEEGHQEPGPLTPIVNQGTGHETQAKLKKAWNRNQYSDRRKG